MIIKDVKVSDAKRLLEIYSYYVTDTAITFEEEIPSLSDFENRILNIKKEYPYIVAYEDEKIVGYAYANRFHPRYSYRFCVELSIYLDKDYTHNNIGKKLYEELESRLIKMNVTNLYACISYPNVTDKYLDNNSIEFHEHLGFKEIALFKDCGYKFNNWYSMKYLEKIIGEHNTSQNELLKYNGYEFRKANIEDIDLIIELIQKRIDWMDEVGIKQWNTTNYMECYPRSHFVDILNDLYVVTKDKEIICAGTLYESDDRWTKKGSAYYIHHLVTDFGYKGLGYFFLDNALVLARKNNKEYLRLDSATTNTKLEKYYTDYGFIPVGTCIDGLYEGILREIKL